MSESATGTQATSIKSVSAQALLATGVASWLTVAAVNFTGHFDLPYRSLAIIALTLTAGTHLSWWLSRPNHPFLGIGGRTIGLVVTGIAMVFAVKPTGLGPGTAVWLAITAGGLTVLIARILQSGGAAPASLACVLRVVLLGLATTVTYVPFYHAGTIGAGDAHWYRLMLADYITQLRAGVFPVWIGQSEYAFNGSTAPLRIAPLFQHEGGLLDLLTFRRLTATALCNLTLVVNTLALTYAIFICLRVMIPARPWLRTVLTLFAILSPALLAPIYSGDQYMTFVALPWLPLVLLGIWRLGVETGRRGTIEIALGLGMMWWGHAPMAMWATVASAAAWIWHRGLHIHKIDTWRGVLLGAAVFLSIGAYPFLSATSLDNVLNAAPQPIEVKQAVELAFPGNFLPVGYKERGLSRYQPGYALLAFGLLGAVAILLRNRGRPTALVLTWLALPCLMLPVPLITDGFWQHVPTVVIRVNNAWPMQRLMPFWALVMTFLCAAAFRPNESLKTSVGNFRGPGLAAAGVLVLLAFTWSVREMWKFPTAATGTRTESGGDVQSMLPQNIILTRYSYTAFSRFPYTYTHGFMDPLLEQRLLSPDESEILLDNSRAVVALPASQQGVLTAVNDNNSTFYLTRPRFRLRPNQRYALVLDWLVPPEFGYLQLIGDRVFREYQLPSSGIYNIYESRAFGNGPVAGKTVSLWTDAREDTEVYGIYIAPDRPKIPEFPLARFSLHEFSSDRLPIRVTKLIPYEAEVFVPEAAWLETAKVWTGGYRAIVNGLPAEVARSAQDLVKVKLSPGSNTVQLTYEPPKVVFIAYVIALFSIFGWFAWALNCLMARKPTDLPAAAEQA